MSGAFPPIPELDLLKAFAERCGTEFFANGFEFLDGFPEHEELATVEEPECADGFLTFAQATSSGSFYALWRVDDREDLASLPVVAFGDEGGYGTVATGLRALFRQLGCDWPQSVDWGGARFTEPEEDDRKSGRHDEYVAWLKETFGLTPPDDPNVLLDEAVDEYEDRLDAWIERFQ